VIDSDDMDNVIDSDDMDMMTERRDVRRQHMELTHRDGTT
jgi:hypothetical protein